MAIIDTISKKLNIQPDGIPTVVRLSQNENGRQLIFEVENCEIPGGSTVTIGGTKPDGTVYSLVGSITDNTVTFDEDIQMTAVAGVWDAKVIIVNGGNTVATGRIKFIIDPDVVDPDAVPSSSQLEGLVAQAEQYAEIAQNIATASLNPDSFPFATDVEKLQAAIDYAISHDYASILIGRDYDITGSTLDVTKGLSQSGTNMRRRLTFIGIGESKLYKGDTGYMFSATAFSGDFAFINMHFEGSGLLGSLCDVFDCHRMIRINTFNCSYSRLGWVFDGEDSASFSTNMQSIKNFGDECTRSTGYYRISWLWDCTSFGCLIEDCDYGYYLSTTRTGTITTLGLIGVTVEDCAHAAMLFDQIDTTIRNVNIDSCYFEKNGDCDIYVNSEHVDAFAITKSKFVPDTATYHCIDILLINEHDFRIDDNFANSGVSGSYLIYIRKSASVAATDRLKVNGANHVLGGVSMSNEDLLIYNPYAVFSFYRDGLSNGSQVTLPYKIEKKSSVFFHPIFNAGDNVTSFYPVVRLGAGTLNFNFYAKKRDGSDNTRNDIMGMFVVVPDID